MVSKHQDLYVHNEYMLNFFFWYEGWQILFIKTFQEKDTPEPPYKPQMSSDRTWAWSKLASYAYCTQNTQ